MKFSRTVHESTDDIFHKHNIRSSKGQVYKNPHNLHVKSTVYPHSIYIFHKLETMNQRIMNWIAFVNAKPFQHLQCICFIDKDTIYSLHHFNPKKITHLSKMSHIKLKHHGFLKLSKHKFIISSKYKIINIETHNQDLTLFSNFDEQIMFIFSFFKSSFHKVRLYTTIPNSRGLFKAIPSSFLFIYTPVNFLFSIAR